MLVWGPSYNHGVTGEGEDLMSDIQIQDLGEIADEVKSLRGRA